MSSTTLDPAAVDRILTKTVEELASHYHGVFSHETVDRYVRESYQHLYRTAKVKQHLPMLAGRFAADRLRALGQARGQLDKAVPEILFVCVQNAGRSQMAAALLDRAANGRVHVRSAGSIPAGEIDETVTAAMSEVGLDLQQAFPKPLTDDVVQAADVVITMGCGDACPIYPGKRYLDWHLLDPAGQSIEVVRRIRDDIDTHVKALLTDLNIAAD